MAIVKYMLFLTERPIAVKFNYEKRRVIIGGHPSQLIEMQSIVKDYFGKSENKHKSFPARNKVRMEFDYSENNFEEIIRNMMEQGLRLQAVASLGRLIR